MLQKSLESDVTFALSSLPFVPRMCKAYVMRHHEGPPMMLVIPAGCGQKQAKIAPFGVEYGLFVDYSTNRRLELALLQGRTQTPSITQRFGRADILAFLIFRLVTCEGQTAPCVYRHCFPEDRTTSGRRGYHSREI